MPLGVDGVVGVVGFVGDVEVVLSPPHPANPTAIARVAIRESRSIGEHSAMLNAESSTAGIEH